MNILIKPIITEKATNDSELFNRYAFVVAKKANKLEIREAIEKAYVDIIKKETPEWIENDNLLEWLKNFNHLQIGLRSYQIDCCYTPNLVKIYWQR